MLTIYMLTIYIWTCCQTVLSLQLLKTLLIYHLINKLDTPTIQISSNILSYLQTGHAHYSRCYTSTRHQWLLACYITANQIRAVLSTLNIERQVTKIKDNIYLKYQFSRI